MTEPTPQRRSVVVEREFTHPPEKIWRALTQPHLIAEWLMQTDFVPEVNHKFQLSGEWGAVDCRVLETEPLRSLSYTWDAFGLESVVTWTLTPTARGTLLRMEQAGFTPEQDFAYNGAQQAWPEYFTQLEAVLARTE